jgi:hypothetical protein
MAKYLITEKAGRFVAGHRNTGIGTVLELLPHAAEYELRLGTLVPADLPRLQVEAANEVVSEPEGSPDKTEEAPDTGMQDPIPDPAVEPEPEEPAQAPASGKRKRRG